MREILFRGKRVDNGEWVEGFYFKAERHWNDIGIHEDWIADGAIQNGGWCNVVSKHAVIPETVGQYTGLTDKNGKKIFEGDIVLFPWGEKREVFSVEFVDGAFEAIPKRKSIDIWCIGIGSYSPEFEVIGNIHDNRLEDFENGC